MGSKTSTTKTKLPRLIRQGAREAGRMVKREYPAALEEARGLDLSDPAIAGATRDEYLRNVEGYYTSDPYLEEEAQRASDVAQRGIAGMLRNYGSGAYARTILDARRAGYLDVRQRERARQYGALGLAPTVYDVATQPQRDLYRRRVADPMRISAGYGEALGRNPLILETTVKSKQPFDWGGFFAGLFNPLASSGSLAAPSGLGAAGAAEAGGGAAAAGGSSALATEAAMFGTAAACWVAEELWGVDDPRTHAARAWVLATDNTFTRAYRAHGQEWAAAVRREPALRERLEPLWAAMAELGAALLRESA